MSDMNNLSLVGRLVRDVELKQTTSGTNVASLSLAVNEKYGDTEYVNYFDCTAFGRQAEVLNQYVQKGHRLGITGKIKQNRWNDKDSGKGRSKVEIIILSFMFLNSKGESGQAIIPDNPFSDDDIPT